MRAPSAKAKIPPVMCRHYIELKQMMHSAPEVVHAFLDHLTEALIVYVCYQIDSGAQASMQCLPCRPHCLHSTLLHICIQAGMLKLFFAMAA